MRTTEVARSWHGRVAVVVGAAVIALAAACGSSGGGATSSAAPASTPTTPAARATVALVDTPGVGRHLVGPDGRTLYLFEKDQGTTTACTGACAANWPALTAASPVAGPGLDTAKLSTATGEAPDQVVYNGHLLYYFAGDTAPGQVNGTKIPAWYPVDAAGDKIDGD